MKKQSVNRDAKKKRISYLLWSKKAVIISKALVDNKTIDHDFEHSDSLKTPKLIEII